ncbi:hypothetical protein GCM10027018_30170 [Paenibacillus thermoaerophilus]
MTTSACGINNGFAAGSLCPAVSRLSAPAAAAGTALQKTAAASAIAPPILAARLPNPIRFAPGLAGIVRSSDLHISQEPP